jgi:hypothetical protein
VSKSHLKRLGRIMKVNSESRHVGENLKRSGKAAQRNMSQHFIVIPILEKS